MAENLSRHADAYALAIEAGNYRAAAWEALRALRREPGSELWRARLAGSFRRRRQR